MLKTALSVVFLTLVFSFVSWRKYKQHKTPKKQWEGNGPNGRTKSVEELEQEQNKYRGFGQISGPM